MPDVPKRMGETIKLMPNAPNGLSALYVNRGLGTVGAPVRLGVPPEITHIIFRQCLIPRWSTSSLRFEN